MVFLEAVKVETAKSQWLRLWNSFGLSSLMISIGLKTDMDSFDRAFMIGGGAVMGVFNFANYLKDRKEKKEQLPVLFSTRYDRPPVTPRLGRALRMMDIVFWGPMMVRVSKKYKMSDAEKLAMCSGGILTMVINGYNLFKNRKQQ